MLGQDLAWFWNANLKMQVKATQKNPRQYKVSPEGEREERGERFRDRQVKTLKFGLHTKISKFMK